MLHFAGLASLVAEILTFKQTFRNRKITYVGQSTWLVILCKNIYTLLSYTLHVSLPVTHICTKLIYLPFTIKTYTRSTIKKATV